MSLPLSQTLITKLALHYAEPSEQADFQHMLSAALEQLHEGSVARYRLRRSEYIAWRHAINTATN